MKIKLFRVQNFRRLKDVRVDLDGETTIFVGANNSGKTSATHVFQRFLDPKVRFQVYDFTVDCWKSLENYNPASGDPEKDLPKIYFDIWFDVDDTNIHRVVGLLPGLDWDGDPVGVRMVYEPKDAATLVANYQDALSKRPTSAKPGGNYKPWPENLTDYLRKRLNVEYEVKYYVLDFQQCDEDYLPNPGYEPFFLGSNTTGGAAIIGDLVKVDFLNAQRHLTDLESRGRAEDLSRRLGRYYQRNLPKFESDIDALSAIADSESALNGHFSNVFGSILKSIERLGYPGSVNPGLVVKASFNMQSILSSSAKVHYALPRAAEQQPGEPSPVLPDQYNGLGFKNLIYMAIEIMDFYHAWAEEADRRPPVHLIMIEEPEAHLHAQLQQVFIRKVFEMLPNPVPGFHTQLVVTTHSSHILYESSFLPVRYFCRAGRNKPLHYSDVKNLSTFYGKEEKETREFLQQYLKLTHCDLFFADAAVLVEGNVERLLLPLFIERHTPELAARHLTVLEVGGAFAHKFHELLEFLELTTLVITDIDSVRKSENADGDEPADGRPKACMTTEPDATTSNEALRQWFPKHTAVKDLLDLPDQEKIVKNSGEGEGSIRVAYQTRQPANWSEVTELRAGRTLEEAFALENLSWTQEPSRKIGLSIRNSKELSLEEMHEKVFEKIKNLDKTRFALGIIAEQDVMWRTPHYIVDGLYWLRDRLLGLESLSAKNQNSGNGE